MAYNPAMNTMLRLFIAIELDATIRQALARTQAAVQAELPAQAVRWVPPANSHLTLKFLGDTPAQQVEPVAAALQAAAAGFAPFELAVSGFGCFPHVRSPRVMWVGVEPLPRSLLGLQRALDLQLSRLGFAREERAFAPHLTIGRVQENLAPGRRQALADALAGVAVGALGTMPVHEATLFRSEFTARGMVYAALAQARLTD